MRILLIDHYDSFTWNLAHLVAAHTGVLPTVVAHDDPLLAAEGWADWDAVVLSPGPGTPLVEADARNSRWALRPDMPVLGVCLGMQVIAHACGAHVGHAPAPRHGRASVVRHAGDPLFDGIPSPFSAIRYHSLACTALPEALVPTAWAEDGVLMALRHATHPWWGVQFHPESIATEHGARLLGNFLAFARRVRPPGPAAAGPTRVPPPETTPTAPRAEAPDTLPALLSRRLPLLPDPARLHAALGFRAPAAWLDGTAPGSRFSLLGDTTGPLAHTLTYRVGGVLTRRDRAGETHLDTRLYAHLRAALLPARPRVPGLELPFALGYVGALGYELRADLGAPVHHPAPRPDAELLFLDRAVVLDHAAGETWLLALDHPENHAWLDHAEGACRALTVNNAAVGAAGDGHRGDHSLDAPSPTFPSPAPRWRHDRAAYLDRIHRALTHLRDGESYELCLTNRVELPCADPLAAWAALRARNPAPFAALLLLPDRALVSSSPERFLRVEGRGLTAQPIKGTRRRHADPAADEAARRSLRESEKDRAENLMIVDLLRNDLGRVATPGSVTVPVLYGIESYPRVHQMVSTIAATLRPGLGAVDALEAAFPPGSMTGAPKLRSMALLESLEGAPRGLYSGVVGYFSLSGDADWSVVIRAAEVADGVAGVGVGGAVVALSDPEDELAEMELKAEVLLEALLAARQALPAAVAR